MSEEQQPQIVTHRICDVSEVALGEAKRFMVGDMPICIAHCNNGFHAIADTCTHADYSLAYGEFDPEACEIECPQHGSYFSFITGEPSTLPATEPVAVFHVAVQGSDLVMFSRQ